MTEENNSTPAPALRLAYGWNEEGKFVLMVLDQNDKPLQRVSVTREQVSYIVQQMRFGRKGVTKFLADHQQLV